MKRRSNDDDSCNRHEGHTATYCGTCMREAEARIKTLESHRMTWWRRAWYAHDIIGRMDPAKAEELVRDWDRETPSHSEGGEK